MLYDLLVSGMNKFGVAKTTGRRCVNRSAVGCSSCGWVARDIARAAWFFQAGQRIVVVRCFVKKSQKTPPAELELARKRMTEYLSRRRAGGF